MDGVRRRLLKTCTAAACAVVGGRAAAIGDPLTLVLPFAPGGGPDVLTRLMARSLELHLGQKVVVSNRVGAAGMIGAESVARAAPDGSTLLCSSVTLAIQQTFLGQSRLDLLQDFEHISLTGTGYSVVVVAAGSPIRTFDDLVGELRRRPGGLAYGSGGIGSLAHISSVAVLTATGTQALHVPYRGSVDLQQALDSGDVAFAAPVQSTAIPWIRRGRMRPLAISAALPSERLPGVPTLRQVLGTEDGVVEGWSGLSAPKGTPEPVLQRVHAALLRTLAEPALVAAAQEADSGMASSPTPAAFRAFVAGELGKFARLARTLPQDRERL